MLIYQSADKGTDLIRLLLKNELMALDDEKVLFREESPGLKAFNVFSRMVGIPYLWNIFALPIAELEVANNQVRPSLSVSLVRTKETEAFPHWLPVPSQQQGSGNTPRTHVSESDPTPLETIFSFSASVEVRRTCPRSHSP
jgi:hypothetical protein